MPSHTLTIGTLAFGLVGRASARLQEALTSQIGVDEAIASYRAACGVPITRDVDAATSTD